MKGTSVELQEIALIGLLSDQYILGKCVSDISEDFFEDVSLKVIYRCLRKYFKKYNTMPTGKELSCLIVEMCNINSYIDKEAVINKLEELYNYNIDNEDFLHDKIIDFIRRNRVEKSLNDVVSYMNNDSIDLEKVAESLSEDLSITFSNRQQVYNLSDVSNIKTIKADALGDEDNPRLVKFFIDAVNSKMQYNAIPPGTLNMVSAAPGCGKTTMMINQGVCSAIEGYKVLHIFLGDMSNFDGLLRYLSNLSNKPTEYFVGLTTEQLIKEVQYYNQTGILGNIYIASYAQCELTATQLIEEIVSLQKKEQVHFDVIIVDYDENISKDDEDNIYESGGLIYNKLGLFAVANKSVVFIVAQPKPSFWSKEIVPLEAAAESSKKQKIIDLMITMGKHRRSSSVGTIFIAKNRRGEVGNTFRIKIDGQTTRIEHISQSEYDSITAQEDMERRNSEDADDEE